MRPLCLLFRPRYTEAGEVYCRAAAALEAAGRAGECGSALARAAECFR